VKAFDVQHPKRPSRSLGQTTGGTCPLVLVISRHPLGSLKESLERDGSSPALAGARTGNKPEHPGWCRLTWCCGNNQDIRCAIPCLRSRKRLARHCFGVCPVHLRTARPKLLGSLYPSIRAISDRFRSSFTRSWAALCRLDRSSIWEKVVPCCVSRRWSDLGLMLTALATLCKLGQVVRDAHRTVRSIVRKLVKVLRWIKLTPFRV